MLRLGAYELRETAFFSGTRGRVRAEHGIGITIYPVARGNWVCPAPGASYGMCRAPTGCCAGPARTTTTHFVQHRL